MEPINSTLECEFSPHRNHSLSSEGITILTVNCEPSSIKTENDLAAIFDKAGDNAIVLIQRESVDTAFFQRAEAETNRGLSQDPDIEMYRWNKTGGLSVSNALPHIHSHYNCHLAPTPTDVGTTFFTRTSIIEALQVLEHDRSIPFKLRCFLHECLEQQEDNIFFRLHYMKESCHCSEVDLLQLAQKIHQLAAVKHGTFTADLSGENLAMVGIPPRAVHGRDLTQELYRNHDTAWRYFSFCNA